ncbi:MAG: MacS family sensor histidine kinase, partial [Nocardioidaceae bacterium]
MVTGTVPASVNVDNQLFRALAALRLVTLLFAGGVDVVRIDEFDRSSAAIVVVCLMGVWTPIVSWLYASPERRGAAVLVADLVVTLALLRSTPFIATDEMMVDHVSTLTSYWVCVPVLAWAIRWGPYGGAVASVVVSVADVTMRPVVTASTIGNVFLLLLAGVTIGFVATSLRTSAERRAEAERRAATAEERERLARAVHDGVLQVLAMVQRRGAEAGGEFGHLARLAGEQESALRSLVRTGRRSAGPTGGRSDLVAAVDAFASATVTVATPARSLELPAAFVDEIVGVVGACLANTALHVGPDAPAWVLLETDAAGPVRLSVRDDGPGIAEGRLEAAAADGRMGVA